MTDPSGYEAPTIQDIFNLSIDLAKKILGSGKQYDCIVGISRGGLIPSRLLSDFLGIKDIRIIRSVYYTGPGETLDKPQISLDGLGDLNDKRVLIVDDVADTGDTLNSLKNLILERGVEDVAIATLYVKPWRKIHIDYFVRETDKWIVFPWEIKEVIIDLKNSGKADNLLLRYGYRDDFRRVMELISGV